MEARHFAAQVNGAAFAADKSYRIISTKGILHAPYSEILRNTTVTLLFESEVRRVSDMTWLGYLKPGTLAVPYE
jgi:hypothetical protein